MKDSTVKLNLRLPKALHRHLVQQAKRNKTSLNTEIIDTLERSRAQKNPSDVLQEMAVYSRRLDHLVTSIESATTKATAGAAISKFESGKINISRPPPPKKPES